MMDKRTEDTLLEVEGLRIEAASQTDVRSVLVDDVSFALKRGEVLGLIGESGAGKSTIGLSSMHYTRPGCAITAGRIIFNGRDIREITETEERSLRGVKIAYVAQSAAASFNPALTIGRQVCEVVVRHKLMSKAAAKARAVDLFRSLDLPNPETFGQRYPHQVSGGQLQRAMAAMAMIAEPELLVFDEPTTALDVTTQVEVLAAFRALVRERGTAALYITHDLAVVAQIADRIMVLRHGKMVEVGSAETILHAPQDDYTKRLVAERNAAVAEYFVATSKGDDTTVLCMDGLVASYRGLPRVIDNVSMELTRGDTLAVVGESGSGKSTLARVIVGLLPRESGKLVFQGKELSAALAQRSREELRRIQMIYQNPDIALNPKQTLLEIIGRPIEFYLGKPKKEIKERVLELLRQIELPESFITRRPPELSGGQKQRVCIARALAAQPDAIICDEVTSALDPLVAEDILKLLRRLQEKYGLAYLFITHDLGTVRRIANKVAIMRKGQVLAYGETADVFSPPYHPYTGLLLSSVPEMRSEWLDEVLYKRQVSVASVVSS
ncbi:MULTISPECIES: ABC transporter ATP-binding protein [unclassified Rhizobium]|jgi:peptide/nickel transport system ATP-binding protein|uniref:ABC transporter ATP-binding protein n=1 Tax=unclassified Rhizobium TaxID=2613769 RepID=UPI000A5FF819|nr:MULTISPECIES: ABC transporter ATP-binding protein [unclassified Rhizobium]RKD35799.1 peptide/nickel transport system ATP-binding protein [Rhizobium sp. WW_1]